MKKIFVIGALLTLAIASRPAYAADGAALVKSNKCDSCHKMAGPAVKTIKELEARKAPDLFYAGSKFNKDWLVKFLQNPSIIRPAGTVYVNFLKKGEQDTFMPPPKMRLQARRRRRGGSDGLPDDPEGCRHEDRRR